MRFVFFYHSLISDWNHGNAHFLRGVVSELMELGHEVRVLEPAGGWSLAHLLEQQGDSVLGEFMAAYPQLWPRFYDPGAVEVEDSLDGADVVLVHEWNDPSLVKKLGDIRRHARFKLFFHDTHHRAVSAPHELDSYDLSNYDGVLVFGEVLRQIYNDRGWAARAWTWHEAADTRRFHPLRETKQDLDLVWVGNWGDGERAEELRSFLFEPVRELRLRARVYGVRYPRRALSELEEAGISYGGWLANFRVPSAFAAARSTVHIPRRFYSEQLPGIPTIRVFEALACGTPLVCAPWEDSESLFEPGVDYLVARDAQEMRERLRLLQTDRDFAQSLARHGYTTIRQRHTCAHRARELLSICEQG